MNLRNVIFARPVPENTVGYRFFRDASADRADAVSDLRATADVLTYDGNFSDIKTGAHHTSGEPVKRKFVLGSKDPRDAALAEKPLSEDVAWTGRIFNVNRLRVELPDGRKALRDVVRHPGAVAVVALTDEGRICLVSCSRALSLCKR